MNELNKVIEANEKVLWEDKPKFWPYFLTGTVPVFFFAIIWLGFLAPFIAINFLPKSNSGEESGIFANSFFFAWNLFLIPFLLAGLWMLIGAPLYKWLLYRHLFYAITNKRVLIQKGVIGRDKVFTFFKKVSHEVKTDIQYPNQLRPKENPGYQTDYDPNKT